MKKLLLLLFIVFSIHLNAQKIHFTDTTNVWNIIFVFVGDATPEYTYTTDAYERDTVIGANSYRYFNSIGWVREDTLSKKVYFLYPSIDSEILFMDYNLVIGDTVRHNGFTHVVGSLDSTLINGLWYKVWHFLPLSGGAWDYHIVEGIGCVEKPYFILNPVESESYYNVYCFSNNGTIPALSPPVMVLNNTTSCSLPMSLFSVNNIASSNPIEIFPNPASRELTIKMNSMLPFTITILNMLGQTVQTIQTNKQEETIDVSHMPAGVYNVCISNGDGSTKNNKLVIVH